MSINSWESNNRPEKSVLLVIDAQKDFLAPGAPYQCVDANLVIAHIADALDAARKFNIPVIFTREAHLANGRDYGMEAVIGEPPHCVVGTPGIEIVDELKPQAGDIVIDKRRYSAFLGTSLEFVLNSFGRPTLFVTGFCTNACVYSTTMDAFQYDFQVHVICECVSGSSHANHETGLAMLRTIWDRLVISYEEFIQIISEESRLE